jgi:hypothetical protein
MSRTASDEENKRIIMDLDVLVKSFNFPYIVRCLGYFIRQVKKINFVFSCFFNDYLDRGLDMYGIDGILF